MTRVSSRDPVHKRKPLTVDYQHSEQADSTKSATEVISNEGPVRRRAFSVGALLHSPSLEETGIRGVLLDIGGIALFGGIHFGFCLRHVFAYFGIVTGAFVASIGRRHGRHFFVT
jgi:hypothetical protein